MSETAGAEVVQGARTPGARYPDFVIVGAAKSGTTTLFRYLRDHPGIHLPEKKEPEFYALDRLYPEWRGEYEAMFAEAGEGTITGEGSQTYTMWPHFPHVPERMHADIPDAKLVYVMRDPVARAYSFFLQLTKMGQIAQRDFTARRSFEECLFPERHPGRCSHTEFMGELAKTFPDVPGLMLEPGDYELQLEQFLRFYDREQIHLVVFEHMVADPARHMRDLFGFLGVERDVAMPSLDAARTNVSSDYFESAAAMGTMMRIKQNPLLSRLAGLAPEALKSGMKSALLKRSASSERVEQARPAPMQPDTRQWLQDYYRPRLASLRDRLGVDTSVWEDRWESA